MESSSEKSHRSGEPNIKKELSISERLPVDTYGGRVHVEWDSSGSATPLGQLAFFVEFLKQGNLFDRWVDRCPLNLTSPNAPKIRDILGTILLSVLSGHKRYAHITAVRHDRVNQGLLGMKKVVSEDSVRGNLKKIPDALGDEWLSDSLTHCYEALLSTPWILDVDTTVKCLYGKQEGSVKGYNPKKPGRPSHTYHTYMMGNIRLVLDVEVLAGNESAASHTSPLLFNWLDQLPRANWPEFLRADNAFGNEAVMRAAEARELGYLFKLKQTKNVKALINEVMFKSEWESVGQGWEGIGSELQLMGWSKKRRVVVLKRRLSKDVGVVKKDRLTGQQTFHFADMPDMKAYEYAVLVTNLSDEVSTLAQSYRDRCDCENNFDELKNQWGWSGFTTRDLARSRLMAKIIALIYNWWTLFVRLVEPNKHLEAVTSRPLLLHSVARKTKHAGQTRLQITSTHAHLKKVQSALTDITLFFKRLTLNSEQLSRQQRWRKILERAFGQFMKTSQPRLLKPPGLLPMLA